MRFLLCALCLLLPASAVASADKAIAYGSRLAFTAYRNGEAIGRHELTFSRDGPRLSVATRISLSVKFLGFTAYRYAHVAQEVWEGDRLLSLSAQTDDNGTRYDLKVERTSSGLMVRANDGLKTLRTDLLPSSHWNPAQPAQTVLLNTQTGRESRVKVALMGREQVRTSSAVVLASRYRYNGDVEMDQWFDERGRWVKTAFTASDGSRVEYVLDE